MGPTVLVTCRTCGADLIKELEKGADVKVSPYRYQRPLAEDELVQSLVDVEGVVAGGDVYSDRAISSSRKLRVISRYGVGLDKVDLVSATRNGIVVTFTPGLNSESVAELAIALMMNLARNVSNAEKSMRAGLWESGASKFNGIELHQKTLGVIGLGAIGTVVAKRLKGFEMKVLAYDPYVSSERALGLGVEIVNLDRLLKESDLITVHTPLTNESRHLIGAEQFKKMKPTAFLINTSRGAVIDEEALYTALVDGTIAGAGLDVFEREPLPGDHRLRKLPNVVLTPHMAGQTTDNARRMDIAVAQETLRVLKGIKPLHIANPDVLTKIDLRNSE
jgi:D-3-phosphoglycerate dehydrogenase